MKVATTRITMRRIKEISDAALAFIVAVVGMTGMAVGFATFSHPFDISPSLDGTLMAAQLGFVFAVLHGLRFRRVLSMMAPVLGVVAVVAARQHESAFALVGVTLTFYGIIGVALAMLLQSARKRCEPNADGASNGAVESPYGRK